MTNFESVDAVLDFAIEQEEAAAELYRQLASAVKQTWMQQIFEDFAMEEVVHKQKLLLVKAQKLLLPAQDKIMDLRRGDYMVSATQEDAANYQQALVLAMQKENAAFTFYTDLAASTDQPAVKSLFNILAEEEAKHQRRFELEYDTHFSKGASHADISINQ